MWSPESLRFGAFLAPFHPLSGNPTLQLRRNLDLMEFLDHIGYDEAWMGEHHSTGSEIVADPTLFIAAAAERTKRIRFGTGVVSLPYHHPLITADKVLQLDHQSNGRLILGTGPGKLPLDAYMQGIDTDQQRRMQGEALDAIVRLLRGETVSMETDWFTLRDARLQLRPYSHQGIEVSAASTISPSGSVLAGTNGLSLLSLAAASDAGFEALDRNWEIYEKVSAENGHIADRANWRVLTPIFLAETREEAERAVSHRLPELVRYVLGLEGQTANPPEWARSVDGILEQWRTDTLGEWGKVVIGTPEDAIQQIEALIEKTGGFGTLLLIHYDMAGWDETKRSYELFANEVIPHFRRSNVQREASLQYHQDNAEMLMGNWVRGIENAQKDYDARGAVGKA
ncbi:MAG: LLM class flavin-dependent oxidoreductase [Patulibacter sp.]